MFLLEVTSDIYTIFFLKPHQQIEMGRLLKAHYDWTDVFNI